MQKRSQFFSSLFLVFILSFVHCGGSAGGGSGAGSANTGGDASLGIAPNFTSSTCENLQGLTASFWEYFNGIPQAYSTVPTPGLGWILFQHQNPLLGFQYPPNWNAFTINPPGQVITSQTVGVDVIRNDNQAIFEWLSNFTDVSAGSAALVQARFNAIAQALNLTGDVQILCTNNIVNDVVPGTIQISSSTRAITIGETMVFIGASVTLTSGISGGNVTYQVTAAPIQAFETEVANTFLPISFQLLIGDPDKQLTDTDADGTIDQLDPEPNNPNVP